MDRTSFVHRVLSLLCSVSFALFSVSANVSRPCLMHGPGDQHLSEPASTSHGDHHAPAGHSSSTHQRCQCGTSCCGAPAFALLASPLRVSAPEVASASAALRRLRSAPTLVRAHALPFAIGPPASVSG